MSPDVEQSCATCRFGIIPDDGNMADRDCRYNSPQIVVIQDEVRSYWPRPGHNKWCGRWELGIPKDVSPAKSEQHTVGLTASLKERKESG